MIFLEFSFEHILNWFGNFTPQLKLHLMVIRKQNSPSEFEQRSKKILHLFRSYLLALSGVPAGAARARTTHQLLDLEIAALDHSQITCKRNCAACCETFPKQITQDEAQLLAQKIQEGLNIDRQELQKQAEHLKGSHQRCIFLSTQNDCRIYTDRPAICRKHRVYSAPEKCRNEAETVTPTIDLIPEIITSAAMSLPDNPVGSLPAMVWEQLQRPADH